MLADGKFYSVFEENNTVSCALEEQGWILTVAHKS